jgi:hypothetical protein
MTHAFWVSLRDTSKELHHWIGDQLRTDTALRRHLHNVSYEPVGEVHVDSLIYSEGMEPHRFAFLEITRMRSPGYESLWQALRQNLKNLILKQREEHVRDIPLLELSGLSSSKSRGPWKTFEEFGRAAACQVIPHSSDADFQRNMAHSFPQRHQPFDVWKVWWNGRTYWMNSDGSHHAAAAFVQALDQGRQVSIPCVVTCFSVHPEHAQDIIRQFFALVVTTDTANMLHDVLCHFEIPFQTALYKFTDTPLTLLFLPRSSPKARVAADTIYQLTSEGQVFDFTQFLRDSIATALGSAEERLQ